MAFRKITIILWRGHDRQAAPGLQQPLHHWPDRALKGATVDGPTQPASCPTRSQAPPTWAGPRGGETTG
jgi:hypothetical protein